MITDFHAHVFPDDLAERAISSIEAMSGEEKAHIDGTVSGLLSSMDKAGIDRSVILSIATKPGQFDNILAFSKRIASERLVPFLSVHPSDPESERKVERIAEEGFRGLKLHPYYQDYYLDAPEALRIYKKAEELGLIVVSHTGFDVAFPMERRSDPERIAGVLDQCPDLKFVTTHLGGWRDWDQVRKHLTGRHVYMEISYSLQFVSREEARFMILSHPPGYMLFGTDSPWQDQEETLSLLRGLDLDKETIEAMLVDNPSTLLD